MKSRLIALLESRADDEADIDELESELEDWKEEYDDLVEESGS